MVAALRNEQAVASRFEDEAMLLIDMAGPPPGHVSTQRFGFADPGVGRAQTDCDQPVDPLDLLSILLLLVQIIGPHSFA